MSTTNFFGDLSFLHNDWIRQNKPDPGHKRCAPDTLKKHLSTGGFALYGTGKSVNTNPNKRGMPAATK